MFNVRLAAKNCTKRFDEAAKAHWLEMGVLSISLVTFRTLEGQLAVDV